MARKSISFRDPVWLIPMVIVVIACSVQTFHLVQHAKYCKSNAEWTSIYEQKAEDALDEDDS